MPPSNQIFASISDRIRSCLSKKDISEIHKSINRIKTRDQRGRVVDKNEKVMYSYNKEVRNYACEEDVQEPDHLAQGDC